MASTVSTLVVIACPQCGTRYQVAPETLGRRGRKVTCAHCGGTWRATAGEPNPSGDQLFGAEEEAELDAAFAAAEKAASARPATEARDDREANPAEGAPLPSITEIKAAMVPRRRPAAPSNKNERQRQKDFVKRQAAQGRNSPLARFRRGLRLFGVATLIGLIACGVTFRTEIVRQFPDLAGAYEALGLGVNVVGLEFRDVTTLLALKGGANVLRVDARIYSVAARRVPVPPVVVTLLDSQGSRLYEWSVAPAVPELRPGEIADFTTQLSSPPSGAARVRLTFSDGRTPAVSATADMED